MDVEDMIMQFKKNVLEVSDGIMALTIGWRKDNIHKTCLEVEEEVFSKQLDVWIVRNLVELVQGLSLGIWADIDGLH